MELHNKKSLRSCVFFLISLTNIYAADKMSEQYDTVIDQRWVVCRQEKKISKLFKVDQIALIHFGAFEDLLGKDSIPNLGINKDNPFIIELKSSLPKDLKNESEALYTLFKHVEKVVQLDEAPLAWDALPVRELISHVDQLRGSALVWNTLSNKLPYQIASFFLAIPSQIDDAVFACEDKQILLKKSLDLVFDSVQISSLKDLTYIKQYSTSPFKSLIKAVTTKRTEMQRALTNEELDNVPEMLTWQKSFEHQLFLQFNNIRSEENFFKAKNFAKRFEHLEGSFLHFPFLALCMNATRTYEDKHEKIWILKPKKSLTDIDVYAVQEIADWYKSGLEINFSRFTEPLKIEWNFLQNLRPNKYNKLITISLLYKKEEHIQRCRWIRNDANRILIPYIGYALLGTIGLFSGIYLIHRLRDVPVYKDYCNQLNHIWASTSTEVKSHICYVTENVSQVLPGIDPRCVALPLEIKCPINASIRPATTDQITQAFAVMESIKSISFFNSSNLYLASVFSAGIAGIVATVAGLSLHILCLKDFIISYKNKRAFTKFPLAYIFLPNTYACEVLASPSLLNNAFTNTTDQ